MMASLYWSCWGGPPSKGNIRVGYKSLVVIGDKVTCTKPFICASEATKILIGDDCMFATDNHIRTDDAHAIYDVKTGLRLNPSKDIIIGAHVWSHTLQKFMEVLKLEVALLLVQIL